MNINLEKVKLTKNDQKVSINPVKNWKNQKSQAKFACYKQKITFYINLSHLFSQILMQISKVLQYLAK